MGLTYVLKTRIRVERPVLRGVDLELTIGIRFKMMFKVILIHLVGDLPRRNTEISPGPEVPTPIPFFDHGNSSNSLAEVRLLMRLMISLGAIDGGANTKMCT